MAAAGFVIGAAFGGVSLFLGDSRDAASSSSEQDGGHSMMSIKTETNFSLIDQDGMPRTEQDYKDKYKLIYFGFTYCPAICPTELSKMSEAYLALSPDEQAKIQPIFITVDPERDTAEVMKGYVGLFMPQLVGLTGSVAQVEAAKKNFKVYAQKVPEGDAPDEYTMDHSSLTYYVAPDGRMLAMFKNKDSAQQITERVRELFGKN